MAMEQKAFEEKLKPGTLKRMMRQRGGRRRWDGGETRARRRRGVEGAFRVVGGLDVRAGEDAGFFLGGTWVVVAGSSRGSRRVERSF